MHVRGPESQETRRKKSEAKRGTRNPMANPVHVQKVRDSLRANEAEIERRRKAMIERNPMSQPTFKGRWIVAMIVGNGWERSAYARRLPVGTRRIMHDGYVIVKVEMPSVWDYEHRAVMSEALGRKLATDEEVHHKDEVRTNNTLENLELLSKADHFRLHHGQ